MNDEGVNEKPDLALGYLKKQDLHDLSVDDLCERIAALKAEIARCEEAIGNRGGAREEAEKLFKL